MTFQWFPGFSNTWCHCPVLRSELMWQTANSIVSPQVFALWHLRSRNKANVMSPKWSTLKESIQNGSNEIPWHFTVTKTVIWALATADGVFAADNNNMLQKTVTGKVCFGGMVYTCSFVWEIWELWACEIITTATLVYFWCLTLSVRIVG